MMYICSSINMNSSWLSCMAACRVLFQLDVCYSVDQAATSSLLVFGSIWLHSSWLSMVTLQVCSSTYLPRLTLAQLIAAPIVPYICISGLILAQLITAPIVPYLYLDSYWLGWSRRPKFLIPGFLVSADHADSGSINLDSEWLSRTSS